MTVGTHTWSHNDLARNPYAKDAEQAKVEIEMGISAVHMAAADSERSRRSSAFRSCSIHPSSCRTWPSAISACSRPTSTRAISSCISPKT
jgi:hypothetical protein